MPKRLSFLLKALILNSLVLTLITELYAQSYSISGEVLDQKGVSLKSATVFIESSQKIAVTGDEGKFYFGNLNPGTYEVVVKMLGYSPYNETVTITNASRDLKITLIEKSIVLNEVVIGKKINQDEYYRLFKQNFLGTSKNALECRILNPEVLNFWRNKNQGLLKGNSDEFLIIENKALGYRIKYLLKMFEFNYRTERTSYQGLTIFEAIPGTNEDRTRWERNRLKTYQGSPIHFFRSVFNNTVHKEGFFAYPITTRNTDIDFTLKFGHTGSKQRYTNTRFTIDPNLPDFDSLVNVIDSSFVSFKFTNGLFIEYKPSAAIKEKRLYRSKDFEHFLNDRGSILRLQKREAIIDIKGSYADYRSFLIDGEWGTLRIGDRLPLEYFPSRDESEPVRRTYVDHISPVVSTTKNSLTRWTTAEPQEKLYLHTDKPYYAVGDTIWFKAYVTVGSRHQLSAISGAMYVDLINEKDSIQKSIKLPVTAGMAMGDFTLPDSLKEGNYRIRAYTQWMRNAGEDYFFDKTFAVGNAIDNEVIAKVDYRYTSPTADNLGAIKATLNYTDEFGKALAGKELRYEIKAAGQVIGHEKVKTDANGNISINLIHDQKSNLKGAHIFTVIEPDGKKKISKVFPIKAALSQSDVQFFPESGNLVAGVLSKVGFKALAIDGTGTEVTGTISDNEGREVASFQSTHAGTGSFNMEPEAGKIYTAKVRFQDGSETSKELSKPQPEGYVLAVYPNANPDSILVRVKAAKTQYQANNSVNLIAHSGGEQIFASPIPVKSAINSIWLSKKEFPTGIAHFTLFDQADEPINERVAFIRNQDQMLVKLAGTKQTYKAREKVEIEVEAKDQTGKPTAGNFSVSVIDESKVPHNETAESTILTNILLTSDLKGYIEKPNYYFQNPTEQTDKHLDNLMLTQGYRRFIWKDILKDTLPEPMFKAEKLTTEISGKLVVLGTNRPVAGGKVILMVTKGGGLMRDTTADENGRFKFDNLLLVENIQFTIQGRSAKNGSAVEVIIDRPEPVKINLNKNAPDVNVDIRTSTKEYLANSKNQYDIFRKSGRLREMQYLKTVKITVKKETARVSYNLNAPSKKPDQIIPREDLQNFHNVLVCLQAKLAGVRFEGIKFPGRDDGILMPVSTRTSSLTGEKEPMLIVLDGLALDNPDLIGNFYESSTDDIDNIEVLRTPGNTAIYGARGKAGVILVNTRRGESHKAFTPNIIQMFYTGFSKAREFYAPRYEKPQSPNLPDFRSTIYWNPAVKTSPEGKVKFDFFNADDKGTYKVVIEGINAEGELGREVYRYKVE